MWNSYQSVEGEKQLEQQQLAEAVISADSINPTLEQNQLAENNNTDKSTLLKDGSVSNVQTGDNSFNTSKSNTTSSKTNKNITNKSVSSTNTETIESTILALDSGPEYRVQLAASRIPLNLYQVSSIYTGPYSITEVKDGNYFKYQIRAFRLYTDAQLICSQSKVDNAYLEAYQGCSHMQLGLAVKQTRSLETQVKKLAVSAHCMNLSLLYK